MVSPVRRILVVDDNHDNADSLAVLLHCMGHDTLATYDGMQAVEAVTSWHPEIVFLDLGMPVMNGYEIARRIRALVGGDQIFLIAYTAYGMWEDRARVLAAGFDLFLTKPMDEKGLHEVLSGGYESELVARYAAAESSLLTRTI